MRKILFGLVCLIAFIIMTINIMDYKEEPNFSGNDSIGFKESYNNKENMDIARKIAAMTTAERVAVIGNDEGVLIGISLKSGTGERSLLRERAEKLAKKYYPKEKILVEVQTEKAEKIFSVASYLEKGIPEEILSSRIGYLLNH